ncbi:mandelate racemase/muconate lactonizing enzyme family protein [Haloarcula amylolytica]|uniref:glucarate dehydratase n=1 Tax=Haloarcula amylolytica JCM 13557 TaxID=1227452 RepID=M0KD86_9EURY|nr:mandelate racemase/muconate lactonizing enzyme family protein [Haloarcula amylolytica]EMA17795.1 N-acylamino acid racemase [Haloarcula amylolytica JCM 13557]
MEITGVSAVTVDVPLADLDEHLGIGPYVTNHGKLHSMERVLVRVDTDEGISGWGEMRVFLSPEATESIIEDGVGPMIEGQSPFEIERLRRQVFVEYTNVDMFFAAVETACWDIVGKALDRPVYELLGGWTAPTQGAQQHRQSVDGNSSAPTAVPVAFCLGILSPEESRIKAREALEAGFTVLKTKAGRDWRQDVERIKAMHDEVDGQLEFRLDPNQGWTLDQAVRVGAMLEDAGIYLQYMEQPIRVDSHRSLARLRQRLRQPIAPNEDTYISHNLQSLVEAGAMDVGVIDLTPAGGISGIRQQAAILEDAGVPFTHHCAFDLGIRTAAILHAFTGIPGFSLPPDSTYYGWEADVIEAPFDVSDGCLPAPEGPGLGISIDVDAVEEYRIT